MLTNYLVVFVHIRNKGVVPSNMLKSSSIFTDRSNVILLSWIIFAFLLTLCVSVILSCLSLAALWSPAGKWLTSWLSLVCYVFVCFFTNFPILSWVISCGICLFRFLMFAVFLTMMYACDIIYVLMFLYFSWNVIVFLLPAYMCWSYYFS